MIKYVTEIILTIATRLKLWKLAMNQFYLNMIIEEKKMKMEMQEFYRSING